MLSKDVKLAFAFIETVQATSFNKESRTKFFHKDKK